MDISSKFRLGRRDTSLFAASRDCLSIVSFSALICGVTSSVPNWSSRTEAWTASISKNSLAIHAAWSKSCVKSRLYSGFVFHLYSFHAFEWDRHTSGIKLAHTNFGVVSGCFSNFYQSWHCRVGKQIDYSGQGSPHIFRYCAAKETGRGGNET